MSVALVTGPTGQDGSYLVEALLARGDEVHGLVRDEDAASLHPDVTAHVMDLESPTWDLAELLSRTGATDIYNLAGLSSVARSWQVPLETANVNGLAAWRLMEVARAHQEATGNQVRFVQATSAEIFGHPATSPQDEATPIAPVSPYGVSKAIAHQAVGLARIQGLFAVSVILYNHESPRRPPTFVTRKITSTVAAIARGRADHLTLGNLDASRDFGWAPDYVDAMIRAAAHDVAQDYIVATGRAHTVREFAQAAFAHVGIDDADRYLRVDESLLRPADPVAMVGDASRAHRDLGWEPTIGFDEVVGRMVDADLAEA